MRIHNWLGRHVPDLKTSHWDRGRFVSRCTVCQREMIKLQGAAWGLRTDI